MIHSYIKSAKYIALLAFMLVSTFVLSAQESSLMITVDLDCFVKIDGKQVAKLAKNESKLLPITKGNHIISAVTLDGYYKVQEELYVHRQKETMRLSLSAKIAQTLQNDKLLKKHDLIFVEGGKFKMGDRHGDGDRDEHIHEVEVKSFYIGKYEVTVEKYRMFTDASNYQTLAEREGWAYIWNGEKIAKDYGTNWASNLSEPKTAVGHISFIDAIQYCNWASTKDGLTKCYEVIDDTTFKFDPLADGYRLPTEAEWEFAAIGGRKSKNYKYSGSNVATEVAWTKSNADFKIHEVGLLKPNELGIYDMSGNVTEWCWDHYGLDYYRSGENNNPLGPVFGERRSMRGGGLLYPDRYSRSANRISATEDERGVIDGFRIVRNVL